MNMDEANINVKVDAAQPISVNVEDKHKIDVVVGDAAKMDCQKAINYIKSGTDEIDHAVENGIAEFNTNATAKTNAFNSNATSKTNAFNDNATNKTNDFNLNASNKTGDFNDNASEKTNDFNDNATDKTGDFNDNATDKTNDFNLNASDKTQDFNDNYVAKKQIIDDAVSDAQGYATSASNSADLAKQWAIGDPTEPAGYSSKYWANEASSTVSNMANKDLSNLSATGEAKFVQPSQLATVATTGDYDDLLNKPTIPAAQVNSDWNAVSGVAQILNKPSLATVATSGAYSDLSGTPTIPTVNNATLTVTQNGVSAGTFTANASSDVTIALTDTTYSAFTGADGVNAGSAGLVPAPAATDNTKYLKGDGTWDTVTVSASWGSITGTLSNQTDLDNALSAKANTDLSNLTTIGKSTGASLSFPSSTYDNLVWSANPNTQTATANGIMWLDGVTTTTSQFVSASVTDSNNNLKYTVINWYPASNGFAFMIPVAKGDVVTWQAGPNQLGSVTNFRFIYAQGEV